MEKGMKEQIESLYYVYNDLYNDQLIAACSEYADYFSDNFAPPDEPWKVREQAVSAMKNLLKELYESCDNVDEMLEQAGYTDDLRQFVEA